MRSVSENSRTKYLSQVDGNDVAGGVEQLQFAVHDEVGGSYEAAYRVAVVFSHDYFLVG
jgi:hypothetical protein